MIHTRTGILISTAINDMDNISSTLQQSLMQLVTSVVQLVGTLWLMLTISWETYIDYCLFSAVKHDLYRNHCPSIAGKISARNKSISEF